MSNSPEEGQLALFNKPETVVVPEIQKYEEALVAEFAELVKAVNYPQYNVDLASESSKWKVSSAIQKCIRRNHAGLAQKYVAAMYNSNQAAYLFYRLPIIALEDIGVGDIEACAFTLAICRTAKNRAGLDQYQTLQLIVEMLCRAYKSRTLTDLVCIRAEYEILRNAGQQSLATSETMPPIVLSMILRDGLLIDNPPPSEELFKDFQHNGFAFWYVYQTAKRVKNHTLHIGLNHDIYQNLKVVPHTQYPVHLIGGVPEESYDQHTFQGKKAISYIHKSYDALREFYSSLSIPEDVWGKITGLMLFHCESALLAGEVHNPMTSRLRKVNDAMEMLTLGLTVEQGYHVHHLLTCDEGKYQLRAARTRVVEGRKLEKADYQMQLDEAKLQSSA